MRKSLRKKALAYFVLVFCVLASPRLLAQPANDFALRGSWPGAAGASISAIQVSGGFVFAATARGVSIFDVSDPAAPRLANSLELKWDVMDLKVVGDYGYALSYNSLAVFRASGPRIGELISFFRGMQRYERLTVADGVGYFASADRLQMIDLSDPACPRPIKEPAVFAQREYPYGIVAIDGYAFIATEGGLVIYKVDVTEGPRRIGTYRAGSVVLSCVVFGKSVFMGALDQSGAFLERLDIRDPAHPVSTARFDNQAAGYGVIGRQLMERLATF